MTEELIKILTLLEKICEDIENLKKDVSDIKRSNEKMDKHVDFVDSIYLKIKKPFHKVINIVNKNLIENN